MATNNNYSLLTPLKALYKQKNVKIAYSNKFLLLFASLFTLIIAILSGFKAVIIEEGFFFNFLSVIIGIPILLLSVYAPIHLFISALEKHKQKFWNGLLVFSTYVLPIITIGHILNLFQASTYNTTLSTTLGGIVLLLFIYLIIITIRNSKAFFNTSYAKSATAIVHTATIYFIISVITYLTLLIDSLRGSMG